MTLSVCLIVKDEQAVISRCLACAEKFADEIIVVDTGSTDGTVERAKKFTDKIYGFDWCGDFSAARNFSLSLATCELVMWLDADDVVPEDSCRKIVELKNNFSDYDMAFLPYAAAFDGDEPTFVYYRERIFRRSLGYVFKGAVHEAVEPRGRIFYGDAAIYHKKVKEGDPMRNLKILQNRIAAGISLNEREKFYYGRELFFNKMYREAAAVLENFLEGDGWIENKCEACVNLYHIYAALGDKKSSVNALLRSLSFAPPKSDVCCYLADYFSDLGDVNSAIYWYQTALSLPNAEKSGAFVNRDFSGFIPNMQLCVLYDRLGDYEKANAFNEAAGAIKPHNESYLANVRYFERRLGNRGEKIND